MCALQWPLDFLQIAKKYSGLYHKDLLQVEIHPQNSVTAAGRPEIQPTFQDWHDIQNL